MRPPQLGYAVTHPYPGGIMFTVVTCAVMVMVLPVLVFVNIATVGYELASSLQPEFEPNNTVPSWSISPQLPKFLRRPIPHCEPKDLGKGDTIRVSPSLFEYKVLSSWRTSSSQLKPEDEGRVEYRGGSFRDCSVYEMLFQHSTAQRTQTVTAAVMCPEYPVRVYMEAPVLLAMDEHRGVVGQYYGYDMKMQDMGDEDTRDYRRSVFGMIDLISTDSLGIVLGQHLEAPVSELNLSGDVVESDLNITFHGGTIVYQNGTAIQIGTNNNLAQAEIYRASITNIMLAVQHAVELDLGDSGPNNIFINAAAVNNAFNPNVAPVQVDPGLWMGNHSSYAYGYVVPPYQTWAQMIRAGLPQELPIGNLTGRPWDSKMLTNYLCPFYKLKPTGALLSGVFIGTATMILSVWAAWMTLSAIIAKRVRKPCLVCTCNSMCRNPVGPDHEQGVSYRETHVEGNRNSTVSGTEKGGPAVENHIEELPKSGAATGTAKAIRTVFCL